MLITESQSDRGTTGTGRRPAPRRPSRTVKVDRPPSGTPITENAPLIRVMIVDDNRAVRSALSAFLLVYDDLELVGEAIDGLEALRLCEHQQPDVILMDLLMPRMDGASATRAIRALYPHTRVLILTGSTEKRLLQKALLAGAIGYWLKEVTSDELAQAIRAAFQGNSAPMPEIA
jgi:two-component system, NarL family, response regulator LiaR